MSEFKGYEDYFKQIENNILNKDKKIHTPQPNTEAEAPKKSHTRRLNPLIFKALSVVLALAVLFSGIFLVASRCSSAAKVKVTGGKAEQTLADKAKDKTPENKTYSFEENAKTAVLGEDISSVGAIMVDAASGNVIAQKNMNNQVFPASTTKVMTLLVAAENLKSLDDTFTMTYEITDPLFKQDATVAGFSSSEVINMYDLLYGTILPSGGDAAMGLAYKIAGGEQGFVELMNKKAADLGLKNTHFTNCTGLHDPNHYTTPLDMAIILNAAIDNKLCKKILSTETYTTSKTPQHPEGIELRATLSKYISAAKAKSIGLKGGKTGFTNQSAFCITSFGIGNSGKTYICTTFGAAGKKPAVSDQINIYSTFSK